MTKEEKRKHWVSFASAYASGQCREHDIEDDSTSRNAASFADYMLEEMEKRQELAK